MTRLLWTTFIQLKHNTSLAIDGDAFSPASQGLNSLTYHVAASSVSPVTSPHSNTRRVGRQYAAHGVLNVSLAHSRRDPFVVDYDLWPFDDRNYGIVARLRIIFSIPTCRGGRHSSPRTPAGRLAYSIRVAVATAALPNIAFAGARSPSKTSSPSLTPSSEHTILMDPSLKHENYDAALVSTKCPPRPPR